MIFGFHSIKIDKYIENEQIGISLVDTLGSSVQRMSKFVLEGSVDDELSTSIDNIYNELLIENGKYFTDNQEISIIIQDFLDDLSSFELAINQYLEGGKRNSLFVVSERYYDSSEIISDKLKIYINDLIEISDNIKLICYFHVFFIAAFLLKILYSTHVELKKNKELAKSMYLDTSTGLYNRSKCQEILKNQDTVDNLKERAIIIFDLNDLKKTNDGLGHRAGDDLISSFAEQLRNATNIFAYEIFIGRYGGDEFMAYFSSTEESDVELYIKEVNYLMDIFNDIGEKPFKLSCAAGYCITTEETKNMTMRELFDFADETMYKNKLAMKEKKRQELAEKGIIEPTEIDERLL